MTHEPTDPVDILKEVAEGATVTIDLVALADYLATLKDENAILRRELADARFRAAMMRGWRDA